MVEALLVADDFDCNRLAGAVIPAVQHLSKRALPKRVHDFVSIREVIAHDNLIISPIIIIAVVVC